MSGSSKPHIEEDNSEVYHVWSIDFKAHGADLNVGILTNNNYNFIST